MWKSGNLRLGRRRSCILDGLGRGFSFESREHLREPWTFGFELCDRWPRQSRLLSILGCVPRERRTEYFERTGLTPTIARNCRSRVWWLVIRHPTGIGKIGPRSWSHRRGRSRSTCLRRPTEIRRREHRAPCSSTRYSFRNQADCCRR